MLPFTRIINSMGEVTGGRFRIIAWVYCHSLIMFGWIRRRYDWFVFTPGVNIFHGQVSNASFLKGQGHQGIFSLVKGWGKCTLLLEHFKGTKGQGGNRLCCLRGGQWNIVSGICMVTHYVQTPLCSQTFMFRHPDVPKPMVCFPKPRFFKYFLYGCRNIRGGGMENSHRFHVPVGLSVLIFETLLKEE